LFDNNAGVEGQKELSDSMAMERDRKCFWSFIELLFVSLKALKGKQSAGRRSQGERSTVLDHCTEQGLGKLLTVNYY
jgi:hypothetical protein